jgi:putative phage-type endonuclease
MASMTDNIQALIDGLVQDPRLSTKELVFLRTLTDATLVAELTEWLVQMATRPPADSIMDDLCQKSAAETPVPTSVEVFERLMGVMRGSFSDLDAGPAHLLRPSAPVRYDRCKHDVAKVFVLSVLELLHAVFRLSAEQPVDQPRLTAFTAKAHALNELLPPRWPDLFQVVWKRMCGLSIVAPDASMTEERLVRQYVNVTKGEVERLENLQQGTREWLDARRFRISGSTVASLVDLSPYSTYDEWVVDKLFFFTQSNAAMRHGSRKEAHARQVFEDAMGVLGGGKSISCVERGFMINPDMGGWAGASPDGLVQIGEASAILEIKCPYYDKTSFYSDRAKYDLNPWGIPEQYYCQIQYLMHLLGRRIAYFVVHLPEKTQIMYFRYNPDFATALYETARDVFYRKFLPTAVAYFQGRIPFGYSKELRDVIDLSDVSPFNMKRRRIQAKPQQPPSTPSAPSAPSAPAPDKDLREGLQRRNDYDRYSWSVSVCNASLARVMQLLKDDAGFVVPTYII